MDSVRRRPGTKTPYGPKHPPCRTFTLTFLAKQVLRAAAARTGASESNIVEHLVRLHGGQVRPEELAPIADEHVS